MKKGTVAVESHLSHVSEFLTNKGYDVLEFQHNQANNAALRTADAVVVSGMDENLMEMHDIKTDAVVINASGMTPEMIGERLEMTAEKEY